MGAGAIGCYVGGLLAARGVDVVLVGRPRLRDTIATCGLSIEDLDGRGRSIPKGEVRYGESPEALADREVVLVCVKSAATTEAGKTLDAIVPQTATIVSLQNGVRNADLLRDVLGARDVRGGIVGFNVVDKGEGRFRRTTTGPLVVEGGPLGPVDQMMFELGREGLVVESPRDVRPLQWSKLIMNLNNAVSALTDATTATILAEASYRRIVAAIMEEAIRVLRVSQTKTARLGPLPVSLFPRLLRLPTPIFRLVARAQIRIDPEARSSMWEDLRLGRKTEIDELNGEIVKLAKSRGEDAPINARIVSLVRAAEDAKDGSPAMTPDELSEALSLRH